MEFSKKKKGLHFHSMSDSPIFVPKSYCSLKKEKVFASFPCRTFLFWQKQPDFSNLASEKPIWQPCNVHGLILFTKISKKNSVTSQYPS